MPASPSVARAVLDPNVLVSAAISDRGIPAELIRRSERGEFELVTSAEVLMELLEVLRRPKFRRYITEDEAVDLRPGYTTVPRTSPRSCPKTSSWA